MSSEIPLPLGNHSLSHCMRSSPSFIGLIFICNFKFVLQIFTVSAGQLIKNFYLFSFQFLLHYSYLALYQGAYWHLNKSCRNVWILLGSTIVSLSSVCRPSLKLLDFKGKRMLLNLFCLKLFNLPSPWERKLRKFVFLQILDPRISFIGPERHPFSTKVIPESQQASPRSWLRGLRESALVL